MLSNSLVFGDLSLVKYTMTKGEKIGMHAHPDGTGHLSFAMRGSFRAYPPPGDGEWEQVVHANSDAAMIFLSEWHEIEALTDCIIVNVFAHSLETVPFQG